MAENDGFTALALQDDAWHLSRGNHILRYGDKAPFNYPAYGPALARTLTRASSATYTQSGAEPAFGYAPGGAGGTVTRSSAAAYNAGP